MMTVIINGQEFATDSYKGLRSIMIDEGVAFVEVHHSFFGDEALKGRLTLEEVTKLAEEE